MEKLHLLCNAHLDPAWLWRWNEGLAEAMSTFRVAANFCEQYDGFVFNHNEALLYEWVEEHDPELFARIQKLVVEGKWKIMGGWYLQPDCTMLSGESFLSQIELGRKYFMEKFGVKPTTAINFDPFGHTRGLVQILKATGYDSYLFMRPYSFGGNFLWEGYDGSRILAHGLYGAYSTLKGQAVNRIQRCIDKFQEKKTYLCLWGVGNHGGGPSRIDLEAINALIKESDVEIIHSNAEDYFAQVDRTDLPVCATSLIPTMVGCYTSMAQIKQANRRTENKIAVTEKAMSYASLCTDFTFEAEELFKAKKALAFCQFHDILPGSGIRSVEEDGLQTMAYAEEIADKLYQKAFFKLCAGQKQAKAGTIPVMVFNPHPYPIESEFEVGFMLENQNWTDNEVTLATVYDEDGNQIPCQNEKPDCTFSLDWIQKVSFRAKIAPAGITRFNCTLTTYKEEDLEKPVYDADEITVKNDRMEVTISRKTGLIQRYALDGKVLMENTGYLEVYGDNEDPWGMQVNGFGEPIARFQLMSDADANEFTGYSEEDIPNVRVVEDGAVRMKIQSFWQHKASRAMVEYTIPKQGAYIDVNVLMFSGEPNKMIKFRMDTSFTGTPWGQTAFGSEALFSNTDEAVFQKWCAMVGDGCGISVLNRGIYGGSFTDSSIRLSLLRTPIYAAHPIKDRPLAPHNRYTDHIDMGERRFSFRISNLEELDVKAQIYNEEPRLISFFPSGEGKTPGSAAVIDHPEVQLSSIRKSDKGYSLTLFNTCDHPVTATLQLAGREPLTLDFGKFELKLLAVE